MNEICMKCSHKEVCCFKSKLDDYCVKLEEIENDFNEQAETELFTHMIRCKKFNLDNSIHSKKTKSDIIKSKAIKDVNKIVRTPKVE